MPAPLLQKGHNPLCSMASLLSTNWLSIYTRLPPDPARSGKSMEKTPKATKGMGHVWRISQMEIFPEPFEDYTEHFAAKAWDAGLARHGAWLSHRIRIYTGSGDRARTGYIHIQEAIKADDENLPLSFRVQSHQE